MDEEQNNVLNIITDTNKKFDEKYDQKIKTLTEKQSTEDDQYWNSLIIKLREKYTDLKSRIGSARREGKDPFFSDLIAKKIPSKIKMLEFTHDEKDLENVKKALNNALEELESCLSVQELDVKKEIESQLKSETLNTNK